MCFRYYMLGVIRGLIILLLWWWVIFCCCNENFWFFLDGGVGDNFFIFFEGEELEDYNWIFKEFDCLLWIVSFKNFNDIFGVVEYDFVIVVNWFD